MCNARNAIGILPGVWPNGAQVVKKTVDVVFSRFETDDESDGLLKGETGLPLCTTHALQ